MSTTVSQPKRGRGRPFAFTEESALALIRNRRMFSEPITAQRFRDEMIAADELSPRIGVGSVRRLMKGFTFPILFDPETGENVRYAELPKFSRGRIRLDETPDLKTEREHRMPKLRRELFEEVRKYARPQIESMFIAARQQIIREPMEKVGVLQRRIEELEAEVKSLRDSISVRARAAQYLADVSSDTY